MPCLFLVFGGEEAESTQKDLQMVRVYRELVKRNSVEGILGLDLSFSSMNQEASGIERTRQKQGATC